MKVIQELVAYFERRGKLKSKDLAKLMKQGFLASDAPSTMSGLGNQIGETFYFRVQGEASGTVWGTDAYTADSSLAASAVHAGAVPLGETRVVKVTVIAPLKQYQGTTRNGITSNNYGVWDSAYRVEAV